MSRFLARLVAMHDGWAKPFGEFNKRWTQGLFRRITPVRDLLNGTWLGHPIHPALTDLPIGAFAVAIVLDLVGQREAAQWAIVVGQVTFVASIVTGLADYADTSGTTLTRATLHGTIMLVGGAATAGSLIVRATGGDEALATALLVVGFLVITAGAFVGGDLVFVLGNAVSRHAFRGAGTKWIRLDTGDVTDLAALPEASPRKMRAGINDLVVVRIGDDVLALHATCAHAGGPLDQGTVTLDGCIECPWHGARYRLADGRLRRGPSVYDQPSYEVRPAEGGGYEVRRRAAG